MPFPIACFCTGKVRKAASVDCSELRHQRAGRQLHGSQRVDLRHHVAGGDRHAFDDVEVVQLSFDGREQQSLVGFRPSWPWALTITPTLPKTTRPAPPAARWPARRS